MPLNHHRAGAGDPLVLIHGIGSRWQMFEPVLPRLTPERDVIAIDLPGFGSSPPPPPGTPPSIASITRLVAEFLDELGLERPHVAGNSLGGWISLELARQGRASSAIALSPAGFQTPAEAAFSRLSLWLMVRAARLMKSRARAILASPARRKLAFGQVVAHPERLSVDEAVDAARDLADAPWFDELLPAVARERFSGGEAIEVPVLIAWGERDRLLLPRQLRRAGREIPRAQLMTLAGCGHVPTYDDPELVARVLLDGSSRH